jgi:hypothetical protein
MLGDEQRIIDKHVLEEVFRICHTREIEVDQAEMFDGVPPNSLKDPKVGPRAKQRKKKKVGAHSLTHSTFGVGRHVGALG